MNYKLLILAFLTLSNVSLGYTQVTIGSTEKPVDGALLQLKNINGGTMVQLMQTKELCYQELF